MKKNKHRININILMFTIIFNAVIIGQFFIWTLPVKASDSGFNFTYLMTNFEYNQKIASMGLSSDHDYNLDYVLPRFCDFGQYTNWDVNINYYDYVENFANYLETEENFNNINFLGNNIIRFTVRNGGALIEVYVLTSERPLYICGEHFYTFSENDLSNFNVYQYQLNYSFYQSNYNFVTTQYFNNNAMGDGNIYNDTLVKVSFGSTFNQGLVYSDAIIRAQYATEGGTYEFADGGQLNYNYQGYFENELDNYSNYPVCQLDRRTLFDGFVDSQISPGDRILNEKSKCGLSSHSFYVHGAPSSLDADLQYDLNEYTYLNRKDCDLKIYVDVDIDHNLQGLDSDLISKFSDKGYPGTLSGGNIFGYNYDGSNNVITVPLEDAIENWNSYAVNFGNYLRNEVNPGFVCTIDQEYVHPKVNDYIDVLCSYFGYSYNSSLDIGGTVGKTSDPAISVNARRISGSSTCVLSTFKIYSHVQIVNRKDSSKNSGLGHFVYNLLDRSMEYDTDPLVYDDTDIVDHYDDPDYVVPTTPRYPTTPGTPGDVVNDVVVDSSGNVVRVTNTNNNTNNPVFNNTPTINVTVPGGGGDSGTTEDRTVVIQDDDSYEVEDIQSVVTNVENFLDFSDSFYDEYLAVIFASVPVQVWRPFAIASAFIALACMIGYVLRR